MIKTGLAIGLMVISALASAMSLTPQQVDEGVYALIGPTTGRTPENLALNANFGFIVTGEGVAVIDSGASNRGAKVIEKAVRSVTEEPIRWVINTGSQDHRWLGNGYFADRGATIIALQRTVDTQRNLAEQHQAMLERVLDSPMADTRPEYAAEPLTGNSAEFELGGTAIELHWFGDAHFPGDVTVWLPGQQILFSGDLIYVDRMLSIRPESRVASWHQAFNTAMARFAPKAIVPGHGNVCDVARAKRDTGEYLAWLVDNIRPAAENWEGLDATLAQYGEVSRWQYLKNYDQLHRGNVHRSYVQFENNQTGELPDP
ncbi:MBL fold metallo-hydrolase [Thiohalophilus thiocyanatoxydans]|uniref:Glyoxylase-like metal-dependent hydrolase (Beta-lactamase superfamily II) n=1 Tax=Thiohalophilus thiocyanatoxydans TaxID=381308 RepID=A0A4R8ILB5_9GAMM|nr:MBL fold metallo-hydrolase [Thiohalophilus thiocyanatoxydans]TDY01576.1 glyoxylase-like metal-dependent hydrolase (beta-lactamase superfamily II) [Thiohalophilus thiocyanatoxydans]